MKARHLQLTENIKCMKFAIFQIFYEKRAPVSKHFPAKTDQ